MAQVRIIRTQETQKLRSGGHVDEYIRVTWETADGDGPFVDEFPKDGFDDNQARAAIERRAETFTRLRG